MKTMANESYVSVLVSGAVHLVSPATAERIEKINAGDHEVYQIVKNGNSKPFLRHRPKTAAIAKRERDEGQRRDIERLASKIRGLEGLTPEEMAEKLYGRGVRDIFWW